MSFVFDVNKAVACAAYITKRCDENLSIFILLKMMYGAERHALAHWYRPITGDSFASMRKGPVLSRTYDLIKGDVLATNSDMIKWSQHFAARDGNRIRLVSDPEFGVLSRREVLAVETSMKEISALIKKHGLISEKLHEEWPEWRDPSKYGRGSIPLTLREVLAELIDDESELERVLLEIRAVASAKAALQVAA